MSTNCKRTYTQTGAPTPQITAAGASKPEKTKHLRKDMQQPRLTCVRSRPWRSSQAERAAPSSLDSELSTFLTDCRTGFSAKIQGMQLSRRQGSDSRVGPRMRRGRALPKDAWRLASSSPGGKATDFSSLRVLAVRSASSGGKDALLFLGFGPYVHMNANLSLCTGGG